MDQTRREFLKSAAALGAVGALTWVGVGCSGDDEDDGGNGGGPECPWNTDQDGNVTLDLADCNDLLQDSTATNLRSTAVGDIIVTHTTGEDFFALRPICTHQGCQVLATSPTLNCPCHGSRYHLTGTVSNGPATSPLTTYPISRSGNILTIVIN